MSYLTTHDPQFGALMASFAPVEVRDSSGNVLGHFVPAFQPQGADRQPKISEAEMDERELRAGGRPLANILREMVSQK